VTSPFTVYTTARFDRDFRKLARQGSELVDAFERVLAILQVDPFNRTRVHPVRKLEGVTPGEGQYRIRLARFRFRYDVEGQIVYLKFCSLRREDTYR
jgi:mRNA-degrading endonuclease RelE of RelBE toxin-antitoxin system